MPKPCPEYREKLLREACDILIMAIASDITRSSNAERGRQIAQRLREEVYGFDSWSEANEEATRRTVVDGKPWGAARNEHGNPVVRLVDAEPADDPEDIDLS